MVAWLPLLPTYSLSSRQQPVIRVLITCKEVMVNLVPATFIRPRTQGSDITCRRMRANLDMAMPVASKHHSSLQRQGSRKIAVIIWMHATQRYYRMDTTHSDIFQMVRDEKQRKTKELSEE